MITEVCQVQATGMRMSIQDVGRSGWARFGVPVSGAMDQHAAVWANRLLGNDPALPVLEMTGRGARLKFARDTWIAVTGAHTVAAATAWRALRVRAGETKAFCEAGHGLWTYLAVETGFQSPRWLGSASVYTRGGLGRLLEPGAVLSRTGQSSFGSPAGIAGRVAPWTEQRDYSKPPVLRVWPAPQWELFSVPQRDQFFQQEWTVSPQSDRSGYRLSGEPVAHQLNELLSEPVLVGTVQVPPNGEPIVTMRDGPTVGGYAKLGVVDPADISWLAQIQPGQRVRFRPCNLT